MHAANLAAHPRFNLTTVFDANAAAAQKTANKCNADTAAVAEDLFNDDKLEAVFIASSTLTHCDYILRAAQTGKAILCEKPLDLDINRIQHCAGELAMLSDIPPLQIGFNRRFDPGHAAVIQRVRSGEIGALEKLIITSRDPAPPSADYLAASGGIYRDMMIHDFDLARALLPQEPARLFAADARLFIPEADAPDDADTAMVVIQTAGGALCHINCSRRAVYGYDQRVEAFGAKGMLISGNRTATQVEAHNAQASASHEPLLNFFVERYADSYRCQLDAFADAVARRTTATPSFEDGWRALILANAAEESRRRGCWIDINNARPLQ